MHPGDPAGKGGFGILGFRDEGTVGSVDVVVIGASGDIGRLLTTYLLQNQVVPSTARLHLVSRDHDESANARYGFRSDLLDAFEERAPDIDVARGPEEVVGDVMATDSPAQLAALARCHQRRQR